MPTYDYRCRKCDHVFEVVHGMNDTAPRRCPECGGRAGKVPSAGAGLIFKGSGFYITDYRSREYQEKAKQEKLPAAAGEGAAPAAGAAPAGGASSPSADPASTPKAEGKSGGSKDSPGKTPAAGVPAAKPRRSSTGRITGTAGSSRSGGKASPRRAPRRTGRG